MGLGDLFKAGENNSLKQRVEELEALLTPEMRDLETVHKALYSVQRELEQKRAESVGLDADILRLQFELSEAKKELVETRDAVLLQEFGLYEPTYDFVSAAHYKDRLEMCRMKQKELVRAGKAATGSTTWTVNNNATQGRKMVADTQKLLLRAFNGECDEAVSKVKFSNYEASIKRIDTSRSTISRLGKMMGISVSEPYYRLKIDELTLAFEYQLKKQEEKEEQKQAREELREQAKLQKEIEEARKEIEKEQKHYSNALQKICAQMESASSDEQKELLEKKKAEIEMQLKELDKSMVDVDYRAANQKAGYVYVISNIGSFGEGVYKIGMTRRLDPTDRVDELGDASVPFNFDIHAMIFSDNAPALEAALHKAFETSKINMINTRREFFRVTLDEIEKVVSENYDKTVEFVRIPDAEQYRQSIKIAVSQQ